MLRLKKKASEFNLKTKPHLPFCATWQDGPARDKHIAFSSFRSNIICAHTFTGFGNHKRKCNLEREYIAVGQSSIAFTIGTWLVPLWDYIQHNFPLWISSAPKWAFAEHSYVWKSWSLLIFASGHWRKRKPSYFPGVCFIDGPHFLTWVILILWCDGEPPSDNDLWEAVPSWAWPLGSKKVRACTPFLSLSLSSLACVLDSSVPHLCRGLWSVSHPPNKKNKPYTQFWTSVALFYLCSSTSGA